MTRNNQPLEMNEGQRLIIAMLADLARPEAQRELDHDLIGNAVADGHSWMVRWRHDGMFEDEVSPDVVEDVARILTMWRFVEDAHQGFDATQKAEFEAGLLHDFDKNPTYDGFDGNNETDHYGVARRMVEDLGRFPEFSGRTHNSHTPTRDRYLAMYIELKSKPEMNGGAPLTPGELAEVVNAGRV